VKRLVYIVAALWALGIASCVVTSGPAGPSCESVTCNDALTQGLSMQGDSLCDPGSDADYTAIIACACPQDGSRPGPCDSACSDNLCQDMGESPTCGDCLASTCPNEHMNCAND
jgi:hypothetical protein